jgi:hypothetical protein
VTRAGGSSQRSQALALAARGFQLIPLRRGSKAALEKEWPNRATADPSVIAGWVGNYGITLAGLVTVDLDVREQHDGEAEWAKLCAEHGIDPDPATFTVRTPHGGRHLVFTVPEGVSLSTRSKNAAPWPGVEIRTDGGHYNVGPGCYVSENGTEGHYELVNDSDPAVLPDTLAKLLVAPPPTGQALPVPPSVTEHTGPIRYHERHRQLVSYAGHLDRLVREGALTVEEAERLMTYRHSDAEVVIADPYPVEQALRNLHDFLDKPRAAPTADDGFGLGLLADVSESEVRWRITGVLPEDGRGLLIAKKKVGKTHLAVNLAWSLLTGEPFLGVFGVQRAARVAYVNGEVSAAMFAGWARDVGIPGDRLVLANTRGRPNPVRDDATAGQFAAALHAFAPDVLVLDTFGRFFTGHSQDDASDVAAFLNRLDLLAELAGVHEVLLVAHAGWSEHNRARGSSALEDWPDSIIRLTAIEQDGVPVERFVSADGRDVDVEERRLRYDPQTRRLSLADGTRAETRAEVRVADLAKRVPGLLTDEPLTKTELAAALGHRRSDAFKAVDHAALTGLIEGDDSEPTKFATPQVPGSPLYKNGNREPGSERAGNSTGGQGGAAPDAAGVPQVPEPSGNREPGPTLPVPAPTARKGAQPCTHPGCQIPAHPFGWGWFCSAHTEQHRPGRRTP